MKLKNRSQWYDINRSGPRRGHKYSTSKHKKCRRMMMLICITDYSADMQII